MHFRKSSGLLVVRSGRAGHSLQKDLESCAGSGSYPRGSDIFTGVPPPLFQDALDATGFVSWLFVLICFVAIKPFSARGYKLFVQPQCRRIRYVCMHRAVWPLALGLHLRHPDRFPGWVSFLGALVSTRPGRRQPRRRYLRRGSFEGGSLEGSFHERGSFEGGSLEEGTFEEVISKEVASKEAASKDESGCQKRLAEIENSC